MSETIIYFDLETGGLDMEHPITQLAAVAVNGAEEIDSFNRLIHVNVEHCDPKALELNGYDPARWEREAVFPFQVVSEFWTFLNKYKTVDCISKEGKPYKVAQLAGYNAATFDAPRLQQLFRTARAFLPAHPRVLDVMQLAMWFIRAQDIKLENHKLATVCKYFGIKLDNAHDALADVRATAQLAGCLQGIMITKTM
jgi:DNA polymerase III subunit epsilon